MDIDQVVDRLQSPAVSLEARRDDLELLARMFIEAIPPGMLASQVLDHIRELENE